MNRANILKPAESGKYIAQNAEHVIIHVEGLTNLTNEILSSMQTGKLQIPDTGTDSIRPQVDSPRVVDWLFVLDSLNFCFWTNTAGLQWTVDGHTGYFALEAAFSRAIKDGYDLANPEYYSKITEDTLAKIMKGDNDTIIPLFKERVQVLHDVGNKLLNSFKGTFETCIRIADKSAVKLVELVVEEFPCFRDEVVYKGKQVSFYKRAQILAADLWSFFEGRSWGEFHDINSMTMFADYRVPQVLMYFGVLSYSQPLMDKLVKDELLPSGSDEEIEIRGCSIHAIELVKEKIKLKIIESDQNLEVPNSASIDYYLWCYRRKYKTLMESIPYHKTLGIYY